MNDHNLVAGFVPQSIAVSRRAVRDRNGSPVDRDDEMGGSHEGQDYR